jgi:alkylation response protein AidB-like acyl-CoA dehydrogenase
MKFELTDDEYEFAAVVDQALTRAESIEIARGVLDGKEDAVAPLLRQLDAMGVPGLTASAAHGGSDLAVNNCMLVLECLGRHLVPDFVAEGFAVLIPVLARHAPAGSAEELLPQLASGSLRVGLQNGWSGWAPWAGTVDLVGVVEPDAVYLTEPAAEHITPLDGVDLTRRVGRVASNAPVRATLGAQAAEEMRRRAALSSAALLTGAADAMIKAAAGYASRRVQFGAPIGSFQGVKHLLADAFASVEASRRTAWWAALCMDTDNPDSDEAVPLAKATIGEAARMASHAALQVHGGLGYTWDCNLHLWMKRCQALEAGWGSTAGQWEQLRRVYEKKVSWATGFSPWCASAIDASVMIRRHSSSWSTIARVRRICLRAADSAFDGCLASTASKISVWLCCVDSSTSRWVRIRPEFTSSTASGSFRNGK